MTTSPASAPSLALRPALARRVRGGLGGGLFALLCLSLAAPAAQAQTGLAAGMAVALLQDADPAEDPAGAPPPPAPIEEGSPDDGRWEAAPDEARKPDPKADRKRYDEDDEDDEDDGEEGASRRKRRADEKPSKGPGPLTLGEIAIASSAALGATVLVGGAGALLAGGFVAFATYAFSASLLNPNTWTPVALAALGGAAVSLLVSTGFAAFAAGASVLFLESERLRGGEWVELVIASLAVVFFFLVFPLFYFFGGSGSLTGCMNGLLAFSPLVYGPVGGLVGGAVAGVTLGSLAGFLLGLVSGGFAGAAVGSFAGAAIGAALFAPLGAGIGTASAMLTLGPIE